MKQKTDYSYDEKTGKSTFSIYDNNITITASAQCAPEDKDIQSPFFGVDLAETRAWRKYYAYIRENRIKPQLNVLKQLYYTMKHSTQFNPKSYEAKMLFRQIKFQEEDLAYIKQEIKDLKREEQYLLKQIEKAKRSRSL